MFGRSIVNRSKPPARRVEPPPPLPVRTFLLAGLGVAACGYVIVRHYTMSHAPPPPPAEREIPAPDLVPVEK